MRLLDFFRPRFTPDEALRHLDQAWEYYSVEPDSHKKTRRAKQPAHARDVPTDG